jgi:hypothetical protein
VNDLPDRAAAARTSLMDLVRLAPAADLAALSRRRGRRRALTAAAVAVVAVLAAIPVLTRSAPPQSVQQPYALDHTISIGADTLVLSPPDPGAVPVITHEQAEDVFGLVLRELDATRLDLYLASVASPLNDPYIPLTPLHRRLAWVLTAGPSQRPYSCGPVAVPFDHVPTPAPSRSPVILLNAVIVDALTGETVQYVPSVCRSAPPTALDKAYRAYSVPFEMSPDGTVVPQLPPCGELFTYGETRGGAYPRVEVLAKVPIAPCSSPAPSPSPLTYLRRLHLPQPVEHAPVGPVSQNPPGVPLPAPSSS